MNDIMIYFILGLLSLNALAGVILSKVLSASRKELTELKKYVDDMDIDFEGRIAMLEGNDYR